MQASLHSEKNLANRLTDSPTHIRTCPYKNRELKRIAREKLAYLIFQCITCGIMANAFLPAWIPPFAPAP